jgi:hypothetical protein
MIVDKPVESEHSGLKQPPPVLHDSSSCTEPHSGQTATWHPITMSSPVRGSLSPIRGELGGTTNTMGVLLSDLLISSLASSIIHLSQLNSISMKEL